MKPMSKENKKFFTKKVLYECLERNLRFCPMKLLYEKANGTHREILCSRCWDWLQSRGEKEGYIPPKGIRDQKESKDYLLIWDLENHGWKNLKIEKILGFSLTTYRGFMYLK